MQDLETPIIQTPKYEKYAECLTRGLAFEPHELPDTQAEKIIFEIVETEGPIHTDEVARRYAEFHRKTRVGQRIQAKVESCLKKLKTACRILKSENFWGLSEQFTNPTIRNRSEETGALTKAEFISLEEIIACAALIEKESGLVSEDDLVRNMSRIFGFMRAGPDFKSHVKNILSRR